jgi:hypothetical protein
MWSSNSVIKLHSTTGLGAGKMGKETRIHGHSSVSDMRYITLNPGKGFLSVYEKTLRAKII